MQVTGTNFLPGRSPRRPRTKERSRRTRLSSPRQNLPRRHPPPARPPCPEWVPRALEPPLPPSLPPSLDRTHQTRSPKGPAYPRRALLPLRLLRRPDHPGARPTWIFAKTACLGSLARPTWILAKTACLGSRSLRCLPDTAVRALVPGVCNPRCRSPAIRNLTSMVRGCAPM